MRRALLSVAEKEGIVELASALVEAGIELVSTGGTARHLRAHGLPVTDAGTVTGAGELLDGRVKTLHPNIHAGILARRQDPLHRAALEQQRIVPIDIVVVNLYPFAETISDPDATFDDALEQIDIGGPAMLRAAAKAHADVLVLVYPRDYRIAVAEASVPGSTTDATRRRLAATAISHTATYDATISQYLWQTVAPGELPPTIVAAWEREADLRYGENPHQGAALYRQQATIGAPAGALAARQLAGKELSYNNIVDADRAIAVALDFDQPAACGVKHANPCGVAVATGAGEAVRGMIDADPTSIFGGIVALNRPLDAGVAAVLADVFLEVVIAPAFEDEALELLSQRPALRLLELPDLDTRPATEGLAHTAGVAVRARRTPPLRSPLDGRGLTQVAGGMLVQDLDPGELDVTMLACPTRRQPTAAEMEQLLLAWRVVRHVSSNAIVLTAGDRTVGIGAGQMNRVGATRIAIEQAGERANGAVLASDAFFPMTDSVQEAAAAGITAIIQPGGSKRDAEVIATADDAGMAMMMTGRRHFRH